MGSVFFTELEAFASIAALLPRPLRETLLLERTDVPEVRSVVLVERLVVPVERLVEVPVLRLVVAELLPVERLVVLLPVERFVRSV